MIEPIIISGICIFIFVLGMMVQKYCINRIENIPVHKSFIKNNSQPISSGVTLDETKVVLKIDTSSLEKKTEVVGSTTITQNDTINAIDKLKSMKGK